MRIANHRGRLVILDGAGRAVDVETTSGGAFSADPQMIYDRWAEFRSWAATAPTDGAAEVDDKDLGAVTPAGVGFGMKPPRYLKAGDELVTWCNGIGEMRHRFVAA